MSSLDSNQLRGPVSIAALTGLALGVFSPLPLYSVEIAQAISGTVVLPAWLPAAIHHERVFSLVVDLAALMLWSGAGEELVCRGLTAVMGAVGCTAVAVMTFAITRSRRASVLMPLAMIGYTWGADAHRYPFGYPLTMHDLGYYGLTVSILTLGLLALRRRAGMVLLGLLPGVHVSLGIAVWVVFGGVLFDRDARAAFARQWRAFAMGLAAVTAIWLWHQAFAPSWPAPPGPTDTSYAQALIRNNWDPHRRGGGLPLEPERLWVVVPDLSFVALAIAAWATGLARQRGIVFWIAGALMMTVPAFVNLVFEEVAPGRLPLPVSAMMLSRWLNLNAFVVPPLALAIGWRLAGDRLRASVRANAGVFRVAAIAVLLVVWGVERGDYGVSWHVWDPADRAVLTAARERQGLMIDLTGQPFSQLRTGRAQLLDATLIDTLPYAPAGGAMTEAILRDVFGASLFQSADGAMELLESRIAARSVAEWRALRAKYGLSDLIVPAEWRPLTLPVPARSSALTLYSISDP